MTSAFKGQVAMEVLVMSFEGIISIFYIYLFIFGKKNNDILISYSLFQPCDCRDASRKLTLMILVINVAERQRPIKVKFSFSFFALLISLFLLMGFLTDFSRRIY